MKLDFKHTQAAHCENGVTTSLLRHHGVNQITEPLAFGIGSGLFFIYIPFMKINNGPAIAFRTQPGLTTTQVMPRGARSIARLRTTMFTAAFELR